MEKENEFVKFVVVYIQDEDYCEQNNQNNDESQIICLCFDLVNGTSFLRYSCPKRYRFIRIPNEILLIIFFPSCRFYSTSGWQIDFDHHDDQLIFKFFKNYLWKLKKLGIIIVHVGGLLLLIGGGLTAVFSAEGNMVIEEGDQSNYVDDYHEMELALINTSLKDSLEYTIFQSPLLNEGERINHDTIGLEIYIISHIKNVRIENRIAPAEKIYKGLLNQFVLLPRKLEKEK